jgi:hypothetical protein
VKGDSIHAAQAFCNRSLGEDQRLTFQKFLEREIHAAA